MRKKSHKKHKNVDSGRIAQKMKTREKLLLAANELQLQGQTFNLAAAAKHAGVSKATAYRYFPSAATLRREAALHIKSQDKADLFADIPPGNLAERVDRLLTYHFHILTENEAEFRLFLGANLEESVRSPTSYSRAGRRILLIEEALADLRAKVSATEFDQMVCSISIVLGIESISVLKDLCQLETDQVLVTWKWLIQRILHPFF